jgi:cell division protein FtsB
MSKVAKIFVIVNLVFAIIYVGVNASLLAKQEHFKYQFLKETALRQQENDENAATIKSLKDKVSARTNDYNTERERADNLDTQLQQQIAHHKSLDTKWNLLNGKYDSLEQGYKTLSGNLKDSRAEIKTLHTQLTDAKDTKDAALRRRDAAQDDLARIQKEHSDLTVVLGDLKKRHVKLAMENQQLKYTIRAVQERTGLVIDTPDWKMPPINGQIVGVSNKANIVVINRGEDDNVRIGFQFTIYRGKEYVAKMVIEKVYPNQAAGRVIEMSRRDKVLVGDKVATRIY